VSLPDEIREFVRQRAGGACEYFSLPEYASVLPHQIDRIRSGNRVVTKHRALRQARVHGRASAEGAEAGAG